MTIAERLLGMSDDRISCDVSNFVENDIIHLWAFELLVEDLSTGLRAILTFAVALRLGERCLWGQLSVVVLIHHFRRSLLQVA